jgi:hypothetical protein
MSRDAALAASAGGRASSSPRVAVRRGGLVCLWLPGGGSIRRLGGRRTPLAPVDEDHETRAVGDTFAGRIARDDLLVVRDEIDFGAAVAAGRLGLATGSARRTEGPRAGPLHRCAGCPTPLG